MEAWQEKRSVHTMNLRSVFTAEQQRILERYYNNGMTNQSKSCFQLILQCAQEAKLDFSVVRTWVGNKRRKLASKVDKNGVMGLSSHTIVGTSGALMTSPVLTEMGAIRGIQHGPSMTHLLPPPASCPSSSSSSSSSTSSSPSSNGASNNNNDVIVTGAYSVARGNTRPDASSQSRVAAKAVPLTPNPESSVHSRLVVHPELVTLQRKSPQVPTSGIQLFNQMRRTISPQDLSTVPPSWAKQYGAPQHQSWPTTSQQPASTNLHRTPPASPAESGVRIKQVFTIAGLANASQGPSPTTGQAHGTKKSQPTDPLQTFSIAMETGDADEYSREEELANMGAQMHLDKSAGGSAGSEMSSEASSHDSQGMYTVMAEAQTAGGLKNTLNSALAGEKGCQTNSALLFGSASCGSYSVRQFSENSLPRMPNHKVNILSAPWLLSNSRKRTLQDRTQFSDGDLYALKRYWDNGMTSLGSVCREKISAAATELNVDSEIVKTWIGNRRRKYRLMGIEIPPPKGGPATFTKVTNADHSPSTTPENGSKSTRPEHDGETNDTGSICLSEGETSDPYMKNNDDGNEMSSSVLDENVKIEIIDEDDDDDDDDLMATDMEEMHNLLEYKHEEVQYLESELENQKLRYQELRAFTKSLLSALKNNDTEKQQELLASLPQPMEEDLTMSPAQEAESSVEMNSTQKDSSVSEGEGDGESM